MGNSDLEVSVVGFGTWPLGGTQYGSIDPDQCMEALFQAIEKGLTLVDGAAVYGNGRAEKVLGKYMDSIRQKIVLVTKCGLDWDDDAGTEWRDASPKRIKEGMDESLERLNTDYVDLFLLHYPDREVPIQKSIEALLEVRESGKARSIGVSNFTLEEMKQVVEVGEGECITNQVPYNMLNRRHEQDLFPYCMEHGIGIMTHGSLCSGLLTGTMTPETTFQSWDWRSQSSGFRGESFLTSLRVVNNLKEVAESLNKTLPQLALNWAAHVSGVSTALFGVRTVPELEENLGAVDWTIPPEARQLIEQILTETPTIVPSG